MHFITVLSTFFREHIVSYSLMISDRLRAQQTFPNPEVIKVYSRAVTVGALSWSPEDSCTVSTPRPQRVIILSGGPAQSLGMKREGSL